MSRKTVVLLRAIWPLGVCDTKRYKKFLGYAHRYSPVYLEKDIFLDFNEIANERKILIACYKKDKNFLLKLELTKADFEETLKYLEKRKKPGEGYIFGMMILPCGT